MSSHVSTVDKVLKNPSYYGTMRVQDRLYEHQYETLISKELFDQADAVREGYKFKPHRWAGLPFAYRGLINCADCGCVVTFETKKRKYTYGRCTQFKGRHGASYVAEQELTNQISQIFNSIAVPEDVCRSVMEQINQDIATNTQSINEQKTAVASQIAKLENRIDRLYEDYIDEKIDETLHRRKSEEYKESIKKLKTQLSTFETSNNSRLETISHLLELSKNAHNLFKSGDYNQKRKLVKMLLSNLELKDTQLRWQLKKPFEMMAFCNNNSTWQPLVEELRTFKDYSSMH